MAQTEFVEKVVFGGEGIRDAITWSKKREDKIIYGSYSKETLANNYTRGVKPMFWVEGGKVG